MSRYVPRSSTHPELGTPGSVERGFLCTVLLAPQDHTDLADVSPDGFRDGRHRTIFQAVRDLIHDGVTPTADAVRTKLEATGVLDRAGGLAYLVTISQETFGPSMRSVYARHLRREAARYALAQLAALLASEVVKTDVEIEPLCALGKAMLDDILQLRPDAAATKRRLWAGQRRTR